jgi:MEDS: MEthanogen/methylotroph, DcmR Sensory domain
VGEANKYFAAHFAALLDRPARCDHIAQLYDDEAFLASAAGDFLAEGLLRGEAAAVIGTPDRWQAIVRRLEVDGVDVKRALPRSQLAFFGAPFIVERTLAHGRLERSRFDETLHLIVSLMCRDYPSARIYNELGELLWTQNERHAALAVEGYLADIETAHPVSFLCAWPLDCLDAQAYDGTLQGLCGAHTHLLPSRPSTWLNNAVTRATNEVLQPQLAYMLHALAARQRPGTMMPQSQAVLLWLNENMPRTAEKVLARVRGGLSLKPGSEH